METIQVVLEGGLLKAADRAAREEQERQSNPLKRAWNNIFGQ